MKPTKRPKTLQVRVAPETHKTITRIAELSDQTISVCVNELLESLLPGLKKTLEYLENASRLDAQGKAHLTKTLELQERELREKIESVTDTVDKELRQHKLPL
jgi:Asp-tRNA(Asn)/Glu-tRNA(Gln) amidotransferase C subunit